MALARARNGDELVEFHPHIALPVAADRFPVPLTFAALVITHQDGVLFVYNAYRGEWELPAGLIEPDETPHQAAIRELYEEAGQVVDSLDYAGIALLNLAKANIHELGAIYTGTLTTLQPFIANTETDRLMFWNPSQPSVEYVNELGLKLADLVRHGSRDS